MKQLAIALAISLIAFIFAMKHLSSQDAKREAERERWHGRT